jgi:hypothetical protein
MDYLPTKIAPPNEARPSPSETIHLDNYGVDCCLGAFVLLPYAAKQEVFRLLTYSTNSESILCQHFPRLFVDGLSTLPVQPIADPTTSHLVELHASDRGYFISTGLIEKNATTVFVFSQKQITESGFHWCRGSSICFVSRYHITSDATGDPNTRQITSVNADTWRHLTSFPSRLSSCKYNTCFPLRVWIALGHIHETVTKILNRHGETSQGEKPTKSERFLFDSDAWSFLKYHFVLISEKQEKIGQKSHLIVMDSCSRKKMKIERLTTFFRFETEEQLTRVEQLFGDVFRFGVRKIQPKLGDISMFNLRDALNVIVGGDEVQYPFKRYTSRRGLDFSHDGICLRMSVRYEKYMFESNGQLKTCTDLELLTGSILSVVGHREEAGENNVDEDNIRIHLDDEFTIGNLVFKATNVTNTAVDAVVVYPRRRQGEDRSFAVADVLRYLEESLAVG